MHTVVRTFQFQSLMITVDTPTQISVRNLQYTIEHKPEYWPLFFQFNLYLLTLMFQSVDLLRILRHV